MCEKQQNNNKKKKILSRWLGIPTHKYNAYPFFFKFFYILYKKTIFILHNILLENKTRIKIFAIRIYTYVNMFRRSYLTHTINYFYTYINTCIYICIYRFVHIMLYKTNCNMCMQSE